MDLPKTYSAREIEDKIYELWEASGYFNPDKLPGKRKESFTISLPPPNATGELHLGHAVMLAIEDIFIRHARMCGKAALWVPGTDHAAIATESVVIKRLQKEGIRDPRKDLGRQELVERIADFVESSRASINDQFRALGSSLDWSREAYTLEPALNRVVNEVFKKMYDDGLIIRGHRIVNWDPKLQTTVSDDEIEWQQEKVPFYYFQYGPFVIATARPETKFGDKYVVMHPDDKRYKKYKHGDTFEAEWINSKVMATVIKDKAIDPEFGSGVMTITPWHDRIDFEIAERYDLDKEQIIGYDGRLMPIAGEFAGMKIAAAREKIVEKLKAKGLLVKINGSYEHNIALNSRGGGAIEPQIKEQWFVDVNKQVVKWPTDAKALAGKKHKKMSLKEVMQDVVRSGDIKIVPARFEKTYFHWIDNLRDWCISRQIWWGHQIPVYYRKQEQETITKKQEINSVDEIYVGHVPPEGEGSSSAKASADKWVQDPDTLDTWFSSALWTWSTLIDKNLAKDSSLSLEDLLKKSPDFKRFHPTALMETGYDLIFFWVARMILMTTYVTGQIPFKTVYFHGLVRDRKNRKMSKSHPETMIDPLEVIAKYGTDALRLAMVVGQSPGNDQKLYKEKIAGYSKFINKIWNICRFILMNLENSREVKVPKPKTLSDKWILSRFNQVIKETDEHIEKYRLSQAIENLYDFTWHELADWYLEIAKHEADKHEILLYLISNLLKLFHPFIPFVTEYLWSLLAMGDDMLLVQDWPKVEKKMIDEQAEKEFASLQEIVTKIRNWKAEQKISPKEIVKVNIEITDKHKGLVEYLSRVELDNTGQEI